MEKLKPDATGIYVAAHQAPGAIEEAIAAEVPLIVVVAEHIPIHDILRVSFGMNSKICLDRFRYIRYLKLNPSLDLWVQTLLELFQPLAGAELASNLSHVLWQVG